MLATRSEYQLSPFTCRTGTLLSASVAVMLALSACAGAKPAQPAAPAQLTFSVKDKATNLKPGDVLEIGTVGSSGVIDSVVLTSADGKSTIPGHVDFNGVWRNVEELALDTSYKVVASARNADGIATTASRTFSTLRPKVDATYRVLPDKTTVGVGMPVMVTFDSAVQTEEMRAQVERRIKVTTTPRTEGSWGWVDSQQLMWRPESYWKPGTKVAVSARLAGVQTGEDKWVREDKGAEFTIARRARVTRVNLADHVMHVRDNGRLVATYPISAGQATRNWETRSGTKIITEKFDHLVMDAATLGVPENDPNYYRLDVRYALRVTDTGEFFHSAPWSVWAQGRSNVSHGCVNMGPSAAAQFFRSSLVGDVAEFIGSRRRMSPGDGVPVWLFSYGDWKKRSALGDLGGTGTPGTAPATRNPATTSATASQPQSPAAASDATATGTLTPSPVPSTPGPGTSPSVPETTSAGTATTTPAE